LNASICQLTYLLAVEFIPTPSTKFIVKFLNELGMDEIHKGISYIALIIVVNRKIKKIDFVLIIFGNFFK
jgi:hypothetical protein